MAVDKSKLQPKKVQVKGKKGTYQAIRYVSVISPGELKKRTQEFLGERKKESKFTRYLGKHQMPSDVDIFKPEDLKASVEVHVNKKTGEKSQYYNKFNIKFIKSVVEFKKPEEIGNALRIIQLNPDYQNGRSVVQYKDEVTEKRQAKKFKRAENTAEKIEPFLNKLEKWIGEKGTSEHKQIATAFKLMSNYDIRVGSGQSIEEGPMKTSDLKSGMIISHSSWKEGTPPHMAIVKEGKVYLRNVIKAEELDDKIKELQFSEERKDPKVREKIKVLQEEKKKFPGDLAIPMPNKWDEVIRVGHYGTTELQARHVKISGDKVGLEFVGKSGKLWRLDITEPDIKKALKDLSDGKSGQDNLFTIKRRHIDKQVKKYKMLPKDLRTYAAGKTFVEEAQNFPVPTTKSELANIEKQLFTRVSKVLHNTPGMAKKSYVPPNLYAAWRAGALKKIEKAQVQKSLEIYTIDELYAI
jgi:DNA topoisomerase IB